MFSMTIVFGASPVAWTLLFKTEEAFAEAQNKHDNPSMYGDMNNLALADDYGQRIAIERKSIHGVMFEDLSKSRLALIERQLHHDRIGIDTNAMRKADPAINAVMMQQSGMRAPGVITPGFGPNGVFPRQ